jgi:hypothetical protein
MPTRSNLSDSWRRQPLKWRKEEIQETLCSGSEGGVLRFSSEIEYFIIEYIRQCPGMHLVESSVWLLVASLLATLKISKAVDAHGNVVEPEVKYENPIFRYVANLFLCPCKFSADMSGI